MEKIFHPINDGGSVVFAIGILVFFNLFPEYAPKGDTGTIIGIGVAILFAVIYHIFERETVNRTETPDPKELPKETFFSYMPLMAFVSVATRWFDGLITLSLFQWIVVVILLIPIAIDLFNNLHVVAQRLYLTSETKLTR